MHDILKLNFKKEDIFLNEHFHDNFEYLQAIEVEMKSLLQKNKNYTEIYEKIRKQISEHTKQFHYTYIIELIKS